MRAQAIPIVPLSRVKARTKGIPVKKVFRVVRCTLRKVSPKFAATRIQIKAASKDSRARETVTAEFLLAPQAFQEPAALGYRLIVRVEAHRDFPSSTCAAGGLSPNAALG